MTADDRTSTCCGEVVAGLSVLSFVDAYRLALAVEGSDTTVILVTDKQAPRSLPLPTALRLELDRPSADRLTLRVAKDRRGRVAPPVSLAVGALSSVDLSFSTRKAPEEAPERAPRTPREGIG